MLNRSWTDTLPQPCTAGAASCKPCNIVHGSTNILCLPKACALNPSLPLNESQLKNKQKNQKKKTEVILSALSLLTLWFHVALAHLTDVHWTLWCKTNYPIRNHQSGTAATKRKGVLYTYSTIGTRISSSNFVQVSRGQWAMSSLSKGISNTLNFHKSIGNDGTQTRNLTHRKPTSYRLS